MELCHSLFTMKRPPNFPPKLVLVITRNTINSLELHRVGISNDIQNKTLETLEWHSVCQQLSVFTSTTMARSVARRGGIPIGKSREESQKLLNQTTAAVDFPHQLDFSAVEDISEIVRSSVAGLLVSVRELCAVKRTLKSATDLLAKLKEVSSGEDNLERYGFSLLMLVICLLCRRETIQRRNTKLTYEYYYSFPLLLSDKQNLQSIRNCRAISLPVDENFRMYELSTRRWP